jgi:hypothetical protein
LSENKFFISQSKYAKDMIMKFGMKRKSHACTSMSTSIKISLDPIDKCVDSTLYKSMIGSLLYITTSRLDINISMGVCARFQANPKVSHLITVKIILKYLSVIIDYGVWYSKDLNLCLVGYSDLDWVGNYDDRKSNVKGCFILVATW